MSGMKMRPASPGAQASSVTSSRANETAPGNTAPSQVGVDLLAVELGLEPLANVLPSVRNMPPLRLGSPSTRSQPLAVEAATPPVTEGSAQAVQPAQPKHEPIAATAEQLDELDALVERAKSAKGKQSIAGAVTAATETGWLLEVPAAPQLALAANLGEKLEQPSPVAGTATAAATQTAAIHQASAAAVEPVVAAEAEPSQVDQLRRLINAIESTTQGSDVRPVIQVLSDGADPAARDATGLSPLCHALKSDSADAILALLLRLSRSQLHERILRPQEIGYALGACGYSVQYVADTLEAGRNAGLLSMESGDRFMTGALQGAASQGNAEAWKGILRVKYPPKSFAEDSARVALAYRHFDFLRNVVFPHFDDKGKGKLLAEAIQEGRADDLGILLDSGALNKKNALFVLRAAVQANDQIATERLLRDDVFVNDRGLVASAKKEHRNSSGEAAVLLRNEDTGARPFSRIQKRLSSFAANMRSPRHRYIPAPDLPDMSELRTPGREAPPLLAPGVAMPLQSSPARLGDSSRPGGSATIAPHLGPRPLRALAALCDIQYVRDTTLAHASVEAERAADNIRDAAMHGKLLDLLKHAAVRDSNQGDFVWDRDRLGMDALAYAFQHGRQDCIDALLLSSRSDRKGQVYISAGMGGRPEGVRFLLESGRFKPQSDAIHRTLAQSFRICAVSY